MGFERNQIERALRCNSINPNEQAMDFIQRIVSWLIDNPENVVIDNPEVDGLVESCNDSNEDNDFEMDLEHPSQVLICLPSQQEASKDNWDKLNKLHKKWSFLLRISSANVTKSAVSCRFGHIYWRKS